MTGYEFSCTILSASFKPKVTFQSLVWLVSSNHQNLFDGSSTIYCIKTTLLLVKNTNIGNHKTCEFHRLLDCIPHNVLAVMKLDRNPSTWFKNTGVLRESFSH